MRRIHFTFFVAALSLIFSSRNVLRAQEEETKPRPQDEAEVQYDQIEMANPHAVEIGLRWLSESVNKVDDRHFRAKVFAAIGTAQGFQLDEAGPNLVALYKAAGSEPSVRNAIVMCAASIRSPHSKAFLEMLRDDQSISEKSHVLVLGALTSLGDDSARKELIAKMTEWSEYLAHPLPWREDIEIVSHVLQYLDDDQIRGELKRLVDAQPDDAARDKLQFALDYMNLNHLSVDELLKIVISGNENSAEMRHKAMVVIGRKGELAVIPKLQKIDAGKIPAIPSSPGHMPFEFSATRDDAIRDIRRHHWRELLDSPTTQKS